MFIYIPKRQYTCIKCMRLALIVPFRVFFFGKTVFGIVVYIVRLLCAPHFYWVQNSFLLRLAAAIRSYIDNCSIFITLSAYSEYTYSTQIMVDKKKLTRADECKNKSHIQTISTYVEYAELLSEIMATISTANHASNFQHSSTVCT